MAFAKEFRRKVQYRRKIRVGPGHNRDAIGKMLWFGCCIVQGGTQDVEGAFGGVASISQGSANVPSGQCAVAEPTASGADEIGGVGCDDVKAKLPHPKRPHGENGRGVGGVLVGYQRSTRCKRWGKRAEICCHAAHTVTVVPKRFWTGGRYRYRHDRLRNPSRIVCIRQTAWSGRTSFGS